MSDAQSLTLPKASKSRARSRRRRPPSGRTVYTLAFMATCLVGIARNTVGVLEGHWWRAPFVALWIALYLGWRWMAARDRAREAAGRALPVSRLEWALLAANVLLSILSVVPL